jgi:LCP family protein required for cell wall assembly
MGLQKINSINAYAEMESEESGGMAISQALSDVFGLPIDYYLRVDFEGFINIVDELDGIEVNVENSFDDYRYPIPGREEAEDYESRFEHLHFDEGWQKMDGQLALKYARSRMAGGVEGSDFARGRRQQAIIEATKNKLLSKQLWLQPKTVADILSELKDHVSTNLKIWEMFKLWEMFKDISRENITNKVLDSSPNGLLVDSYTEEGAYVLIPRSGDFEEIKYFLSNVFTDAPIEQKDRVARERATIEVRNGTWINGLASQAALDLEKYGFIVVRIGNSSRQNFQKSVIYDLTFGEKLESLSILKAKTNANVSHTLPEWLLQDISLELENEKNPIQPDFIFILGQDADTTDSGEENPENTNPAE